MPEMPRIAVAVALSIAMLTVAACSALSGREADPVVVTVTSGHAVESNPSPTAQPFVGPDVRTVDHEGIRYEVVVIPLAQWAVRVDWARAEGGTMLADAAADPAVLVATNAGIFTPSFSPGGLLVADGVELRALNLADGAGNFSLKPNGVFEIRADGTAAVVDSTAYDPQGIEFATQSGPALLLGGAVHPEFVKESTNLAFRSGVGVSPDGATVYLALSVDLTNFHDFATLFSDELGCTDALYLDGNVSHLWVRGDGESSAFGGPYAGVITVRARPAT